MVCGDLVNALEYRKYSDLMNILSGLDSTFYLVPGNHDVGMIPSEQTLRAYRKTVGEEYYSFAVGSTLCIVVNSQLWINQKTDQSREMDLWLWELLESKRRSYENVFLFGHIPFFTEKCDEETRLNSNIPLKKRVEILDLLAEHSVTAVFTAHLHKHVEMKQRGILFSSVESISLKSNAPNSEIGFRIWSVFPDTLTSRFINLTGE